MRFDLVLSRMMNEHSSITKKKKKKRILLDCSDWNDSGNCFGGSKFGMSE
jgi:hypothetical protein